MLARTSFLTSFAFALLAACGGNVVVDQPLNGGAGGTSTTSSSSSSGSSGTTTATTTVTTTSTTTVTTTTTTTWVGPCGGLVLTPDPSCQSCLQGSCCAQLSACAPGSACGKLLFCTQQCQPQDGGCQAICAETYSAGMQSFLDLTACVNSSCALDFCSSAVCGGLAEAPGPLCDACIDQHICGELDACINDAWCVECLAGNQANCEENPLYNDLFGSLEQWCGQACSF